MAGTDSATGSMWIGPVALTSPSEARLVTWVTVQQHAARIDVTGAGSFFDGSDVVGQQQADRTIPSYAHRYQDAVAIDGTRTKVSRTTTMRRTLR